MTKNVLEWLEETALRYEEKPAFLDTKDEITFGQVMEQAKSIGSALLEKLKEDKAPVAVVAGRNVWTPAAFLGVVYSGRAYAPIDAKLPKQRIFKILKTLQPAAILVDRENQEAIEKLLAEGRTQDPEFTQAPLLVIEELKEHVIHYTKLACIRRRMVMTDPLYIIFTSGSTGNPKGVMTSHQSLICYILAYSKVMGIDETDRLGNQSPLDYIAAIRDIYLPLKYGCSTVILPKEYFMEPDNLFGCMNEYGVTAVGWSVSAFTVPLSLGAFEDCELTTLRKICFSGSVMPCKCLKVWQEHLPEAKFVNQYGPTEATASCTYYEVDHTVSEEEVLPIGVPYENYKVFLMNEDETETAVGEEGEICVSGPVLALGYYNDPERTAASFIQNPLNPHYQEKIYRTGDIGVLREDGILEFHGRKDRQIKHMGHRVELDEVEYAANQIDGVAESCCIYRKDKEVLYLFYTGEAQKRDVVLELRTVLPGFMVPRKVKPIGSMPKLPNGKIDMTTLRDMAQ